MTNDSFYRTVAVRRYYCLDGERIPVSRAQRLLKERACYVVDRLPFDDHQVCADGRTRMIPSEAMILRSFPV